LPGLGAGITHRECESCRAAPGIPFCRVEWSFLCAGCAAVVHGQSWIVAVPPGPNPSPSLNPLSSDEDEQSAGEDGDGSGGRKRRRSSVEGESAPGREASMMRYKEKRKSRNFDKTIRYESRKVHADMKPRVGGKFVKTVDGVEEEGDDGAGGEGGHYSGGDEARAESSEEGRADAVEESTDQGEQMRPVEAGEMVATSPSFEVEQFDGGVDLGQMDAGEEVGLL
ncbi:unnamed protein product, partial [Musa banksii]